MIPLYAITKLTFRSAIRSRIFWLLLVILVFCTFILPLTIAGDGTAWGFIQVSLKYTLGIVGFILSLSTVWLSCFVITQDIDSYQLHMVVSKPISRFTVWLGKCLGIVVINTFLLFITSIIIFLLIRYQFETKSFTKAEKDRIRNEVLVGRRAFLPEMPDINKIAAYEFKIRLKRAKDNGANVEEIKKNETKVLADIRKEVLARLGAVAPGQPRFWTFTGITPDITTPLFLRYKPYVGKVSPQKTQRNTMGLWSAEVYLKKPLVIPPPKSSGSENPQQLGPTKASAEQKAATKNRYIDKVIKPINSMYPESIKCGVFNELTLSPGVVQPDGSVVVSFVNFDPERKPIFMQRADGPKLLIEETSFFDNYCRAVLILLMRIIFLAGLSCAIAGFVSMPVAIFSVIMYMLIGYFATYLIGTENELLASGGTWASMELIEKVGSVVSRFLLLFIIPMQNFEVSDTIAGGELIEWSFIGNMFLNFFVLRGLPVFLIGLYVYWRRELGIIIKK